ncbi:Golgi CORVET complex core vacuolar protein 8-domain-containing protein [Mucor mucedo]|uniref:Golgi CORVET complex core vacuolar protein 8-domain-containing protein n=1 Tax=Mucor mucedo TaxID=29922 RepID=UPI00221ED843|nr:Golgi CORVET complex core vacuolar protein 8-domain-containing protein [Mucor mucedo]KAI7897400.1 Golgi CORVET complex core vacuolar protein 8-domain-containing protein [Mucor mucedo]
MDPNHDKKKLNLGLPEMQPSISTNTVKFRRDYDALLKEVLEESSEDEEELLNHIDIDLNAATAELPDDLRAALEDRSLADKYLANLKTFMSHRRSHSISSDFSIPNTPLQSSFSNQPLLSPKPFDRIQPDPLSKVLDAVPYQTRLINGVPSLTVLEQKFNSLRIPELDLPVASDTTIQTRLNGLYKIREDLHIHLNGGPLVNIVAQNNIGEKKKQKVLQFLDEINQEIGLYEEFVKKANYLSLESILNESDNSDEDESSDTFDVDSSILHFDSSSEMSKTSPGTPSFLSSTPPHRSISLLASPVSSHSLRKRLESSSVSHNSSSDFASLNEVQSKENVEPWEAFKWTPLKKISDQLYSDAIKGESGLISVMVVSGVIAIGTTRSLVFVYDYSQNLKCILGDSTRAIELGSVTSLAVSADHTTIACGHSQGYIVIWDIRKPASPLRTINPISVNQVIGTLSNPHQNVSRSEGHVKGTSVLHVGFVGVKKSDLVSADDQGMAFHHLLYTIIMVNGVATTRILGRYQNLSLFPEVERAQHVAASARLRLHLPTSTPIKQRRPNTVFAMQPMPLGQIPHPTENFGLVALLTPYKMIIVGIKPSLQTLYKFLKPKAVKHPDHRIHAEEDRSKANIEPLSGCLAWLPVIKLGPNTTSKDQNLPSDPMLAFAWGDHLFILRVSVDNDTPKIVVNNGRSRTPPPPPAPKPAKKGVHLEFVKIGEYKCKDAIVGIQWINRQILVLFTPNEEMILFDPKNMCETQHTSIRTKQLVYHDWFNAPLKDLVVDAAKETVKSPENATVLKSVEMAYFGSIKSYKGKLFLLGIKQIYVGTLLSWADRILALVQAGDFLESIALATSFYDGIGIQTVIGLPEEELARKNLVGEKLMDLLVASLNYAFSSKRTYEGMADEIGGGETILFHDLAQGCVKACLSMDNMEFLFDTVYDRFAENNVKGVFLEVLEPFIVDDEIPDVPPSIMKDLVDHYSKKRLLDELEQVIWHVNPNNLDIDQIVSMCHREGMYEAMMYVWNKSMHDYVSPVVEMLKVIRSVLRHEGDGNSQHNMHARQNAEKLFDYLKLILTGKSFPEGSTMLASDEASDARSAVYSFVFSGRCVVWPPVGGRLVLTADDEEGVSEPTYPYLRLLLRFSTKKFLEALEVAFEDPWLNGGEDILSSKFEDEVPGKVISRQIIVNTLLDVMGGGLTGNGLPLPPPRPKQSISASTVTSFSTNRPNLHINVPSSSMGSEYSSLAYDYVSNENIILLYMFIASNLHMYTTFILLPPKTLHKVLVRLAEDHDPNTRIEREKAVQNLLMVYTPTNEEQIVSLYEEAGFWKVLEQVYRRDKKYGKLVEAYLKDDDRREMVFECVEKLLSSNDLNDRQKSEVQRVFMIRISQFVEIDGQKAAFIVENFLGGDHADAIRRLEEDQEFDDDEHHVTSDKRLFSYLRGLLEPYEENELIDTNEVQQGLIREAHVPHVDGAIQERYIELMCRFDPSGVFNYFNTKLNDDISLENVKKSCEEYGVMDAVVWIMEKSGDTQGALEKMLEVAKSKNACILHILKEHRLSEFGWTFEEQSTIHSCLIGLNGVLRVGTRLCESSSRSSAAIYHSTELEDDVNLPELSRGEDSSLGDESHHEEEEIIPNDLVETLWFRLLDAYVEGSIEMYNMLGNEHDKKLAAPSEIYQRITTSFKTFVQSILTSLLLSTSPQVSLPRLLKRLIKSQTRGETTFADFRDIFLSMLDTYKYEGQLLEMTNRLFDRDLHVSLQDLVRKNNKGWRPGRAVCEICGVNILDLSLLQPSLAWGFEDDEEIGKESMDGEPAPPKNYMVFKCGHGFHTDCLERQLGTVKDCAVCQHGNPQAQTVVAPLPAVDIAPKSNNNKGKEKAT